MDHHILFSEGDIAQTVSRLAAELDERRVEAYLVVTVLKGAVMFSSDLVRAMETETQLEYVRAVSYDNDFMPGAELSIASDTHLNVTGHHVLIVEDIVDTGRTLAALEKMLLAERPASITTVTLVNKTTRRDADFEPDFFGFHITDEFIYGYGLDWNQQYRDLPYVAIANPEGS